MLSCTAHLFRNCCSCSANCSKSELGDTFFPTRASGGVAGDLCQLNIGGKCHRSPRPLVSTNHHLDRMGRKIWQSVTASGIELLQPETCIRFSLSDERTLPRAGCCSCMASRDRYTYLRPVLSTARRLVLNTTHHQDPCKGLHLGRYASRRRDLCRARHRGLCTCPPQGRYTCHRQDRCMHLHLVPYTGLRPVLCIGLHRDPNVDCVAKPLSFLTFVDVMYSAVSAGKAPEDPMGEI